MTYSLIQTSTITKDSIQMKTLLLFLPFFLLATSSLAASPDPVRDTAGKNLRTNANYFVLPVVRGRGGGLSLVATRNKTCPLDVVQEVQEILEGIPMTFTPFDGKKGVIRESTDLNIEFNAATVCPQYSTYWKLDRYDESRKRYFVTSGGVAGNPGAKTTSNWFKIKKYGKDYKFVFCPTVCKFCKVICKDVGIFVENGRRILALTDVAPLKVKFLMNEFV